MGTAMHEEVNEGTEREERGGNGGTRPRALPRTRERGGQEVQGQRAEGEGLANALGWFSIGLGVAQIVAPGRVARLIGVNDSDRGRSIMRAVGAREIAAGVGILSRPRPAGWVWSRVAGDVMDLALLGNVLASSDSRRNRTASATAAVLGITALDVLCGQRLTSTPQSPTARSQKKEAGMHLKKSITVNRPAEEVYRFWHQFENLPRFMRHLESVEVLDARRSHWKAKAPVGMTVEWDAEIVEDRPNELISWRSIEGSEVDNSGSVRFLPAPGRRGTEVHVDLRYDPPGGRLSATFAKLFMEEPGKQVQDDLHRFKQMMELGEIAHSDASVHEKPHPAQPSEELARV